MGTGYPQKCTMGATGKPTEESRGKPIRSPREKSTGKPREAPKGKPTQRVFLGVQVERYSQLLCVMEHIDFEA